MTPQLRRFEDWPRRFQSAFEARWETPFAWGRHDCCIAAADLVLAVTGADPAQGLRGYSDWRDMRAILRRYGGLLDLADALAETIGAPRRANVLEAKRGDVALVLHRRRRSLGVVGLCGRRVYAAAQAGGWASFPLRREVVMAAWRIG